MDLIKRCNRFLTELGVPVTVFARNVHLSPQSIYEWRKQKLKLSDLALQRIDDYLAKYGF